MKRSGNNIPSNESHLTAVDDSVFDQIIPLRPWSGVEIPRIIHQTFSTRSLPNKLEANVERLKRDNPGWDYRFYDDDAVDTYIHANVSQAALEYLHRVNPEYGAAKADLFRYMLMYKEGGVYLDIKSRFLRPIEDSISLSEGFVISGWSNKLGRKHGKHLELREIDGGEFQQWHIIAAPGHPFLRAVLRSVLANIDNYTPLRFGIGRIGVLRLTGPVAYTLAINPIIKRYPHLRIADEEEIGLEYSIFQGENHVGVFQKHYSNQFSPVVRLQGRKKLLAFLYGSAKRLQRIVAPNSSLSMRRFKLYR